MSDLHGGVCLSGPPFRAEHIGSLLRPKEILEGEAPDRFIAEAIRWQESLGLRVVTEFLPSVRSVALGQPRSRADDPVKPGSGRKYAMSYRP